MSKKNPKAFWKYISVKTKTRSGITVLHCDPNDDLSRLTNNDSHKANLLNEYFASVFTNEPHGNIPILETRTEKEMEYNIISDDEIALLLNTPPPPLHSSLPHFSTTTGKHTHPHRSYTRDKLIIAHSGFLSIHNSRLFVTVCNLSYLKIYIL